MNLSPNLTLAEFVSSQTAARMNLDNSLPDALLPNARRFALTLFEPARSLLGASPVVFSSGYRCVYLNHLVGGATDSAHTEALAGDLLFPRVPLIEAYQFLAANVGSLPIDQLILEFGAWVHLAGAKDGATPRRQLLMKFADTGYLPFRLDEATRRLPR